MPRKPGSGDVIGVLLLAAVAGMAIAVALAPQVGPAFIDWLIGFPESR